MDAKSQPNLPPPEREPKRRLSLHNAMDQLNGGSAKDGFSGSRRPVMEPTDEFPSVRTGQQQEMEAHLLELQAEMVRREDSLNEKERKLMNWERELNEQEALLEARRQVIESKVASGQISPNQNTSEEMQALLKLKAELDAQETALKESREALRDRENYIESCENELVEKSMQLTEREAHIEQREEDFDYKSEA